MVATQLDLFTGAEISFLNGTATEYKNYKLGAI